jgi:putative oxidoreductase
MNRLSRWEPQIYAAFRIVMGLLLAPHGAQKLFGVLLPPDYPASGRPEFPSQMWLGGVIELLCGLAVAVGFQTRWAAFLASGTMAVAYFQFHQRNAFLPAQNGGELAVAYCFAFLLIAAKGSGMCSVSGEGKTA